MHDLGGFIRDQRRMARLSLRKLSELAGISNPYLSQIERGLRKPSAEILQAIARALRISAETLYVRAGILEAREGDSDVVAEILRDTTITRAPEAGPDRDLPFLPDARPRPPVTLPEVPGATVGCRSCLCGAWPSFPCTPRRWPSRASATAGG